METLPRTGDYSLSIHEELSTIRICFIRILCWTCDVTIQQQKVQIKDVDCGHYPQSTCRVIDSRVVSSDCFVGTRSHTHRHLDRPTCVQCHLINASAVLFLILSYLFNSSMPFSEVAFRVSCHPCDTTQTCRAIAQYRKCKSSTGKPFVWLFDR